MKNQFLSLGRFRAFSLFPGHDVCFADSSISCIRNWLSWLIKCVLVCPLANKLSRQTSSSFGQDFSDFSDFSAWKKRGVTGANERSEQIERIARGSNIVNALCCGCVQVLGHYTGPYSPAAPYVRFCRPNALRVLFLASPFSAFSRAINFSSDKFL